MNPIKLTLSVDQVNQILDALGNQPYAKVYELVANIQQQAQTQISQDAVGSQANVEPNNEAI